MGSKNEFDSDEFPYDEELDKARRKYDKKTRRFHDKQEDLDEAEAEIKETESTDKKSDKKPSKNAAKHNTNKVRQEKINKNTEEISEKIYNKENYEEPYYVDATRKIDEMKKESYSYQDDVRRGTVNAEEQEKYFTIETGVEDLSDYHRQTQQQQNNHNPSNLISGIAQLGQNLANNMSMLYGGRYTQYHYDLLRYNEYKKFWSP